MNVFSARRTVRSLTASIVVVVLLTVALTVTSGFLIAASLESDGHLFSTGNVTLNLNDGKPVISGTDCAFAPGETYEKEFTVENLSTCDVWYKLYFANVSGSLADAVEVEIRDGNTLLLRGRMSDLTAEGTDACPESLAVGERRTLTMTLRFDAAAGNELQGSMLTFDFSARAVQTRNNPDKKFD